MSALKLVCSPITKKLIPGSNNNYIDIDGSVYAIDNRNNSKGRLIKKALYVNRQNGYTYCGINYPDGNRSKRVNRLVAEAFIPNPENLPIVGHRNNIKTDNRVENLYWTTYSENTKKAFDDGLCHNDKGFDDSQSKPVNMYNTYTNELIGQFGSVKEASRITGISASTISRQAKYKRPIRKETYFRYADDIDCINIPTLVALCDYDSDQILNVYYNCMEASRQTGIPNRTINQQVLNGKPKVKRNNTYFKYINNNKCEETIEI